MRSSLPLLGSILLVACAGSSRPGASSPAGSSTNPSEEVAAPHDPSPNVLRDRRGESGVRAPAKPLVLDNARSVKCGKLARGTEADEVPLLEGRLRVRAPAGAKPPPPLPDSPSPEEESRIVAEPSSPKEKKQLALAIVAKETFQLDPDLYEPEADAPLKPASLDVEAPKFLKAMFPSNEPLEITPVEIGSGDAKKMRGYVGRPPHPNAAPGKDTALVLALLVAQEDGALQSVGFYVRGEAVRNAVDSELVGCTRLAERIASSLVPGPRKLERAPGRRHVADVSSEEELAVTVPADYVAIPAGKAGTRLTKLRPLSLYAGSISVSVGSTEQRAPEGAETTASGKLFGRPVEWRGKTTPKGGFLFAAEPVGPKGGTAAVLVKATRQAKTLDEMRAVAETLSVVKRTRR
jgi:hypothetical protein